MRLMLTLSIFWLGSTLLQAQSDFPRRAPISFLPPGRSADGFCAANVFVTDTSRNPVQTTVRLIDPGGKVIESHTTSVDGSAEFCDFGFGDHTIQIGEACGFVSITDVRVHYSQTR